jgi:hypothetical protein
MELGIIPNKVWHILYMRGFSPFQNNANVKLVVGCTNTFAPILQYWA